MSLVKTGLIFILTLLSYRAIADNKPNQYYFTVNSELSMLCDSLYYASAIHNVQLINKFYPKIEQMGLQNASKADSMGYYLSRGLSEYLTDKLDASLKSLLAAESLAKRHKDPRFSGIVGNHTGNVYYLLKDNKTALTYYNRVARNDSAPSSARSSVLNNISVVNMEYYQASENKAERDSLAAVIDENYALAIDIQNRTRDYANMAGTMSVMIPWFQTRGMRDSAYHYVEKCRDLSLKNGFLGRLAFLQIKLASLLIDDKRFAEAADTAGKAAEYYERQNNPDQTIHALAFQALAYDSLNNHKKTSAIYHRMYRLMKESFSKNRADAVGKYETKFKTQEKLIENQKLAAENREKQLRLNQLVLALISLFALIIGGFLFYRNRLKKKELELKTQEVAFKNQIITSNMESEEKERKRIARELHDGVGQQISSIKLGLENIDKSQQAAELRIGELRDMVANVLHSVRGISHQMMPLALQRFGLKMAVEELVNFQNEQGEIEFEYDCFNLKGIKIDEQVEIHLYRIIQELTANIRKHSQATKAVIHLYEQKGYIIAMVSDNGIGMNDLSTSKGIGMFNIQSRVNAIGGNLVIDSKPGENNILVKVVLS